MLSRKKNVYPVVSIGEDLDITFSPFLKSAGQLRAIEMNWEAASW